MKCEAVRVSLPTNNQPTPPPTTAKTMLRKLMPRAHLLVALVLYFALALLLPATEARPLNAPFAPSIAPIQRQGAVSQGSAAPARVNYWAFRCGPGSNAGGCP
ncbi:hypothetical protein BDK51DRAFT_42093 [Blyttiomyces helicus]|uniref:Uncharacterized protein n=1 Tax=Blyttiomyces helicus TaxID=388810 RepID=A0A4P9W711_9FUNG|nr:hypothetical protein BDK51DRAFT_42093 [Blyttiomyces helicus]|eukprot:RKO88241.1 hypothetical protein BDK51DRAFT_42093 [Blyttiomyces helicus]